MVVVAGTAGLAAVSTAVSLTFGGVASLVAGVVLIGQIMGEIVLLKQPGRPSRIEVSYFIVGFVMAVLSLLVAVLR
ncbi:MAG TPA: hypothetical protein VF058_00485 [Actinomycetota bacterium]